MLDLFHLYNSFKEDGIIFCFSGPTSQGIIEGVGEALRQKMEREDTSVSISRKVFSAFVEQMQNVINYSVEKISGGEEDDSALRQGIVVVGREKGKFYVLSGNNIRREHEARLTEQLQTLQGMDKAELKAYFKEQRKKPSGKWSKGAGIGLIDTARKASEPLEFKITPVDEDLAFFALKTFI